MKEKENSVNRMWKCFLLCACVGLHTSGVAGQENYTQMHYVRLTIEESATVNVSNNLLGQNFTSTNYIISRLTKTTDCALDTADKKTSCQCAEGHEWSKTACDSVSHCCGTGSCINTNYTCMSSKTVVIYGSLTLESIFYHNCLAESTSAEYINCNKNLTETIKTIYSTIDGFDSLIITKYSTGSVIANFEAVILSNVEPSVLQSRSLVLSFKLNAKLNLETSGVVRLNMPEGPVKKGTSVNVNCTTDTDLKSQPEWQLQNYQNETKGIHNGTESTIITTTYQSNIHLVPVSELWTGKYTCSFAQKQDNVNIFHKATKIMDICAEPNIVMRLNPGFPHCTKSTDLLPVTVSCEVEQTYEVYSNSWEKVDIKVAIQPKNAYNETGVTVFSADTLVSCDSTGPKLTCILTNRCNQTKQSTIDVTLIKVNDNFCKAEGDWMDTKVENNAVIKCKDSVGNRTRPCSSEGKWGQEESNCVDLKLNSVLFSAKTSDSGLGKLETNAEIVFTQLQSVTNNTNVINTVANLETSVNVLDTMKLKVTKIDNDTTVNDFLRSSSNLLDKSLDNSWKKVSNDSEQSNKSLAEKYLSSVEQLIVKANVTTNTKNPPNVELVSCDTPPCSNQVFNNTVTMNSKSTSVKTTGFQQLARYLPNRDDEFFPNSIVVSTTTQLESSSSVDIVIDFQLEQPRPRNIQLKCVFWNGNKSEWSDQGCTWVGDSDKGRCQCNHLSSFAILMSKKKLEVPYLNEVTYVGLSVSIVSLIIFLMVELIIWSDVVKTDTLHLRHCAHVNIAVCLLVGDICFLASSLPGELPDVWCKTFVVVEHFCFLAMFFWMFCLSSILLHKTVYVSLHGVGKTAYLRFSIIVGYICPLLIVVITFLATSGAEGQYYSKETRWLVYSGRFKGSIFTFILPVGIIVFVNVFLMCLVIMKILQPLKAKQMLQDKEKSSAKMVIRSVILLTPVFGVTWGFGFLVILMDLTSGILIYVANYIFTLMNAFQGLYIFLTACVGDRMVREGVRKYFSKKTSSVSSFSTSFNMDQSSIKK